MRFVSCFEQYSVTVPYGLIGVVVRPKLIYIYVVHLGSEPRLSVVAVVPTRSQWQAAVGKQSVGRRSGGPPKTSPSSGNLQPSNFGPRSKLCYTKTGGPLEGVGSPGGKTCNQEGLDKAKSRGSYEAGPKTVPKTEPTFFPSFQKLSQKLD